MVLVELQVRVVAVPFVSVVFVAVKESVGAGSVGVVVVAGAGVVVRAGAAIIPMVYEAKRSPSETVAVI